MNTYNTIIIGAGHNGLIAAIRLAKKNQRVLVVEQSERVGGELAGAVPAGNPETTLLRAEVLQALDIHLNWVEPDCTALSIQAGKPALRLSANIAESSSQIAQFSANDAQVYPKFVAYLEKLAGELEPYLTRRVTLADQGKLLTQHPELVRFVNTPLRETLDFWFESDTLKGTLGALALEGLNEGPYQQGVAFNLLYRWNLGGWRRLRYAQGGTSAVIGALQQAAEAAGAEIRTASPVAQVLVQNGKASGVQLADGSVLSASHILSTADPKATYFGMVAPGNLPPSAVRQLKNYKMRGSTSRLWLTLKHLPHLGQSAPADLAGQVLFAPNLEMLERAFDANKYGELPEVPFLRIHFGGADAPFENAFANHAGLVASVEVRFTPYRLAQGSWDDSARRAGLQKLVLDTLEGIAPGFSAAVSNAHLITPLDLERTYALTEGCTEQGQMLLEQCFALRPVPCLAEGASPIAGLSLAGAGAHPGGGLTGLPGWLWSA
ncbi:MAG TPA: NAD(P)/FAD-dependent oxidoreductase [Flavobacteriales bacterium]|nr:NAD(P)/FAD-dependent oxidoreductase [Flavobacteriales bacterium]